MASFLCTWHQGYLRLEGEDEGLRFSLARPLSHEEELGLREFFARARLGQRAIFRTPDEALSFYADPRPQAQTRLTVEWSATGHATFSALVPRHLLVLREPEAESARAPLAEASGPEELPGLRS
ncbi:MAG: hypothetical protein KM310_00925 [Clostridiales bacterium]|nr:hypothetical protein [Clostridiales bacterium]